MNKFVDVIVTWAPEKQAQLPTSGVYSTVAKFDEDGEHWPAVAWSVVLEFDPRVTRSEGASSARARFLAEPAPSERLAPGRKFELYEGRRKTATVTVI